jgi:HEPN domain-containing protein
MDAPHDVGNDIKRWTESAEADWRNARHTLTLKEDCPFDTVCFHAQQCAEKYLKTLLLSCDVGFPKTHDLVLLRSLLPQSKAGGISAADLRGLNRYSVEARFPGDREPMTRDEAETAVRVAGGIRVAVR